MFIFMLKFHQPMAFRQNVTQALWPLDKANTVAVKIFVEIHRRQLLRLLKAVKVKMVQRQFGRIMIHEHKGGAIDRVGVNAKTGCNAIGKDRLARAQIALQADNVPLLEMASKSPADVYCFVV